MPAKEITSQDAFLAAVIKTAKVKIEPDYDALAIATGMSRGGASNKFRAIMRELEAGGASWTKSDRTSKTTGKHKATASEENEAVTFLSDSEVKEEGGEIIQRKKSGKKRAATAKTERSNTPDINGQEDMEEVPKKKAAIAKGKGKKPHNTKKVAPMKKGNSALEEGGEKANGEDDTDYEE